MHARTARLVTPVIAIALVAVVSGCSPAAPASSPSKIAPVPTTAAEPAPAESPAQVAESTGPIVTPKSGSAERTAVLVAVKTGLGLAGTVTVNQLFVQGTAAVGDVSASGARTFFALTGGPASWKVAWSAAAGSKLASVDQLVAAAPEVSADLAGKLDFAKVIAKSTAPVKAPTLASFKSYALAQAQSFAGASFTGTFTVEARIAKDSKGAWWGNALATPADQSLESIGVWAKYTGGAWKGEIADFSSENADAAYFPADVLARLRF